MTKSLFSDMKMEESIIEGCVSIYTVLIIISWTVDIPVRVIPNCWEYYLNGNFKGSDKKICVGVM